MKIAYFPETDNLYIELSEHAGADTVAVSEGIVLDIDEHGHLVGIDIDQASKHLDLQYLDLAHVPFPVRQVAV
jgi:uncharacterized protein YuzE